MRSLCCAITLALLSLSAIAAPDFYRAAKKCNVNVLEHSFPECFNPGKFAVSAKIKNAGNLPLRGALKVVLFDKSGKTEKVIGKDNIDIPPSSVSNSDITLKINGSLSPSDLKCPIKIKFETAYGEAVCYEGIVGQAVKSKGKKNEANGKKDELEGLKRPALKRPPAGTKITHEIKFIDSLPAGKGASWRKFIENGGVLIVPLIDSPEDFEGALEFCDKSLMPTLSIAKKRDHNVFAGSTPLFDWPNLISPSLLHITNARLTFKRGNPAWEAVQNGYTVALREGYGLLILSTHTCADTPELRENILSQLALEDEGIRFRGFSHSYKDVDEYKGNLWYPTQSGGKTTFSLINMNYATTNLHLAFRMTFTSVKDPRISRSFLQRKKVHREIGRMLNFELAVPALPPEFEGDFNVKTELIEWGGKRKWELDNQVVTFPEMISIVPPDYRATVSTERREAGVYIGIRANRVNLDMGGMKWKLEAKDSSGKTIAQSEGVFANGSNFVETQLPVAKDAAAGKYDLFAEVETPCSGVKKAKSEFKIVAPELGQIIVDQDGFFLNEGKPFFPMGSYHCSKTQWTNAIDETGLCAKDMGFTWMQIWESNWFYNYTLDRWAIGRNIDKSITGAERERMIDCWVETNKVNRSHIQGVALCIEGFRLWGCVLFEQPRHVGTYRFEREADYPRMVKTLVDDPDQLVRMYYCADEANGNYYRGLNRAANWVRKHDPKYHPVFNLGNLPAVMAGDWGGNDIYLRYYGSVGEGRAFAMRVRSMRDQLKPYHRRPFIVPQAFGLSKRQSTETPEWVRLESYASIIYGANGLGFYCWKQVGSKPEEAQGMGWNPATAHEVKKIIAEIKVLHPALRVPGQMNLLSFDGHVHALLCGDETTGRHLICVNVNEGPVDTGLPVPGIEKMKFEPLFGAPAGKLNKKKDALAIKLPTWGTAVWRIK